MTVQIEVDENLIKQVDEVSFGLKTSRTKFVEAALTEALRKARRIENRAAGGEKVKRFLDSYEKLPQQPEEYEIWQNEQVWTNE